MKVNINESIKENMPLISVIVPVYNVEKYIEECLISIKNQTYKNLEIIIVNDGSKDRSIEICKKIINKDKRFLIFNQDNQGLSAARNNGLALANGEYFTFVDSDDYLEINMIESLLESLKDSESEISLCPTTLVKSNGIFIEKPKINGYVPSETIIDMFFKQKNGMLHTAWGKLFKMDISEDVKFPVGRLYEDQFVIYNSVLKHKCSISSNTSYYYRIREGSIITNNNNVPKKTIDMMDSMKILQYLIKDYPRLKKSLDLKLVNDSIVLVKYNIIGKINNESYKYSMNIIRNTNIFSLYKEGMGISHLCQYILIKYFSSLFKAIYLKRKNN